MNKEEFIKELKKMLKYSPNYIQNKYDLLKDETSGWYCAIEEIIKLLEQINE